MPRLVLVLVGSLLYPIALGKSLVFDSLNRVTRVVYDNEAVVVYEYDLAGNIVSKRTSGDADPDTDGTSNAFDNCPFDANVAQLDNDLDNLGNACDPDDDNDGLPDGDEEEFGTNPLLLDTDGDGVADGTEITFGSDPTNDQSTPESLIQLTGAVSLQTGLNLIGTIENQFFVRTVADWIDRLGGEGAVESVSLLNPLTGRTEACGFVDGSLEGEACNASLVAGRGWFVRFETEQLVAVDAPVDCQRIELAPGPNLVSFPCLEEPIGAFEFLERYAQANGISAIESLDGSNARWRGAGSTAIDQNVGRNFEISRLKAYLIHSTRGSSLDINDLE